MPPSGSSRPGVRCAPSRHIVTRTSYLGPALTTSHASSPSGCGFAQMSDFKLLPRFPAPPKSARNAKCCRVQPRSQKLRRCERLVPRSEALGSEFPPRRAVSRQRQTRIPDRFAKPRPCYQYITPLGFIPAPQRRKCEKLGTPNRISPHSQKAPEMQNVAAFNPAPKSSGGAKCW